MQVPNNQSQSPYIPSEAYLYFPKVDNTRHADSQRAFFDGNTQFTANEHQMIQKFRSYSVKEKYTLKPLWTDNMILRFLYANNFKMNKTLASVQEHTIWRESKLPVQVDESLQKVLNSGILYVHGRDQEFRPIVIFNVYMIDPKKVDVELITRALTFWFEYVINEMMLPGQVENWVFIADVKGMSASTLMQPNIRQLFGYLQDNYKCRLHRLYVLNVPSSLYVPWQVIKKFLDDVTVQKIQICKGRTPNGLLDSTNSQQVEQKYGGSANNATQYWPPVIPSNNYFVTPKDSEALISEEQYINLYQSGVLSNMHVDQSRINRHSTQQPSQLFQSTSSFGSPNSKSSSDSNSNSNSSSSVSESSSDLEDSIMDEEDMDDLNEMMEGNKINMVKREFHSAFLGHVYSH